MKRDRRTGASCAEGASEGGGLVSPTPDDTVPQEWGLRGPSQPAKQARGHTIKFRVMRISLVETGMLKMNGSCIFLR